jgi:hypothetical protein
MHGHNLGKPLADSDITYMIQKQNRTTEWLCITDEAKGKGSALG